jgi:alkylation response protein AidB-like acyl-CoA dehydrogenase
VDQVLDGLRARATEADLTGDWPQVDLRALAGSGAARWAIPSEFGGLGFSAIELHFRYEAIASASLSVALLLSQRDSAADMIDAGENDALRRQLLPPLALGRQFATIGIAQLTTSRQGGAPALRATPTSAGYGLDGYIPWSTGAAKASYIVAGAALPDQQQILFALPTDLPGVEIEPPMPLVALRSSWTARVNLENVSLDRRWILRGPTERALGGRRRHLVLGQTFLAMGLARSAILLIQEHRSDRAQSAAARLEQQLESARSEILDLSAPGQESNAQQHSPRLRGVVNDLAIRAAHTAVTLYKGSALLNDHPAQRLAREAMFLLVWSCPDPVIDCTVDLLTA